MAHELNLELGLAPYDPWEFKKKLSASDVGHNAGLYLSKKNFENAIISVMDHERVHYMNRIEGLQVKILVIEQGIEYTATLLKIYGKYFLRGWHDIVSSLDLKVKDEIGLLWNNASQRLYLHHLK